MTSITDFNRYECDLIPGAKVNAYVTPKLNPLNTSELIIDSTWGEEGVDLTPAIKYNETTTHLKLSPSDTPLYLEYDNEDGDSECIYGEDLAGIIPIMKLKDVNHTAVPEEGDTLVYDATESHFDTYPLVPTIEDIKDRLDQAEADITALKAQVNGMVSDITQLKQQMIQVLALLTKPAGIPADAKISWGTINLYADYTNDNLKTNGFFTHNPANDIPNDERFA